MAIIDIATIINLDTEHFAEWVRKQETPACRASKIAYWYDKENPLLFNEWIMMHVKKNTPIPCMLLQEYIKEL